MQVVPPKPDLVLIDDDSLIRVIWETEAKMLNQTCYCFSNVESFKAHKVSKNVPLFIDYRLGERDGLQIASDLLHDGYRQVYITSGYGFNPNAVPPGIKGVVGKEYPEHLFQGKDNVIFMETPIAQSRKTTLSELTAQLAHDIRSTVTIAKNLIKMFDQGTLTPQLRQEALTEFREREQRIEQCLKQIDSQFKNNF